MHLGSKNVFVADIEISFVYTVTEAPSLCIENRTVLNTRLWDRPLFHFRIEMSVGSCCSKVIYVAIFRFRYISKIIKVGRLDSVAVAAKYMAQFA
jgi:hypothetical protein